MPFKTWADGEEVDAGPFNSYIQAQVVAVFPDAATRTSQWPTPPTGACSALVTNPGVVYTYTGSAWVPINAVRYGGSAVSTNQSIPSGAYTNVSNFSNQASVGGATISGAGVTLPTAPGLLAVSLRIVVASNPAANQYATCGVFLNGASEQLRATITGGQQLATATSSQILPIDTAGTAWSAQWYQNTGAALNCSAWLYVYKVGP